MGRYDIALGRRCLCIGGRRNGLAGRRLGPTVGGEACPTGWNSVYGRGEIRKTDLTKMKDGSFACR